MRVPLKGLYGFRFKSVKDLLEKFCSNYCDDLVRDCYGRVWSRGVRSTNRYPFTHGHFLFDCLVA